MTKREIILELLDEGLRSQLVDACESSGLNIQQLTTSQKHLNIIIKEVIADAAIDILYYNICGRAKMEVGKCFDAFLKQDPEGYGDAVMYALHKNGDLDSDEI